MKIPFKDSIDPPPLDPEPDPEEDSLVAEEMDSAKMSNGFIEFVYLDS